MYIRSVNNRDSSRSYPRSTMVAVFTVLSCAFLVILGSFSNGFAYELIKERDVTNETIADVAIQKILTPQELAEAAGCTAETHYVTTEDGYILQVNRITGSRRSPRAPNKPAVLLLHGLLDSSVTWVISTPEESLGFILADWGYDVWMGNVRGNRFSRGHTKMTTADKQYWTFSWHEIGMYDIPAMIDHVLSVTKQEKIFYIGHSQGGTSFFVMASERPEYQNKLIAAYTLAPAVFMGKIFNPIMRFLAPFVNDIEKLGKLIGMTEFKPTSDAMRQFAKLACDPKAITLPVCKNIMFLIMGFGEKQIDDALIPKIVSYAPAGASVQQLVHYAQLINSGKFRKLSYGLTGNLRKYGTMFPPDYNLRNVKMPVYLFYSENDWMVDVSGLNTLYKHLSNTEKFLAPNKLFTHLDFVWGKHANTMVFDRILSLMERAKQKTLN